MLWKHPVSYLYSNIPESLPWHLHRWSHQWFQDMKSLSLEIPNPEKCFLTWWPWPMTLTFTLDLDILPLDPHAEIHVRMSVRSAMRAVTHTQKHTMSKLLHSSLMWGVKRMQIIAMDQMAGTWWTLHAENIIRCPLINANSVVTTIHHQFFSWMPCGTLPFLTPSLHRCNNFLYYIYFFKASLNSCACECDKINLLFASFPTVIKWVNCNVYLPSSCASGFSGATRIIFMTIKNR